MKKGFSLGEINGSVELFGEQLFGTGIFRHMEVHCPYYDITETDPLAYTRNVAYMKEKFGPSLSLHIPSTYDPAEPNTKYREIMFEHFSECVEYAQGIGADVLVLHPGTIGQMDIPHEITGIRHAQLKEYVQMKKEFAWKLTVESFRVLSDIAGEYHGMRICAENLILDNEICCTMADMSRLLKDIGRSNVGAVFDNGHCHRTGENAGEFIRTLGDKLWHLHLTENDGTCDLHLMPGELGGNFDWREMMAALGDIGYDGVYMVEGHYFKTDDLIATASFLDRLEKI